MRRRWTTGLVVALAAVAVLGTIACESSGDGNTATGDAVVDASTTGSADAAVEALAETLTETLTETSIDTATDTGTPEAVSEVAIEVIEEIAEPEGCDLETPPDSFWALKAPVRETDEEFPLCTYRGDVVLIVNTAAS